MLEFFTEYGIFLAKLLSVVGIILISIGFVSFMYIRSRAEMEEHLNIKNLNKKYEHMKLQLNAAILPKKTLKKILKELKKEDNKKQSTDTEEKKRIFVLRFKGDIRATDATSLSEEISALLTVARKQDEVVLILESSGGTVHGYGYAASQLCRIKDKGIKLTVAVDKVAASGGYMMACVANQVIAAPFAIIGSIGVLGQIPNFNRLLKKHDIDVEQSSAGKYKRTLTLFGENTEEGRKKFQEELEETHELFKSFVKENREQVDIETIATGEHWYGKHALELKLVDQLRTSDDYLTEAADTADIYEITYTRRKSLPEKLFSTFAKVFE